LNGQVTDDVRQANDQQSIYACVTDLKGHGVGDVFVHAFEDALWLDAEPRLREVLGPRLERYIIADNAELGDVTDDWQVWHVFGPAAETEVPSVRQIRSERLGVPGMDVWLRAKDPAPALTGVAITEEDFEALRILRGIPRWPQELNASTFPPEAGLDVRAMSYTKGCYIGQEVLSRIRTTGSPTRPQAARDQQQPRCRQGPPQHQHCQPDAQGQNPARRSRFANLVHVVGRHGGSGLRRHLHRRGGLHQHDRQPAAGSYRQPAPHLPRSDIQSSSTQEVRLQGEAAQTDSSITLSARSTMTTRSRCTRTPIR